jgi:hypothetical protein
MDSLLSILDYRSTDSAWIRVERRKRSMYGVSGNGGELPHKVGRGTQLVVEGLYFASEKNEKV